MLFPAGEFIKKGILEMAKIFIDSSYGTTGLRIHQRLQSRTDLELISIPYEERHSESARRKDGSTVSGNQRYRNYRSDTPGGQCFSITGYSGGGKKMIGEYESDCRDALMDAPRMYGLSQQHKHLPEITALNGLECAPIFCPIVSDFYCGMETIIPLFGSDIHGTMEDIRNAYREFYTGPLVYYKEDADENGFVSANTMSGRDDMELSLYGNSERLLLVARFDNLGKGASGSAIQNLNLMMGVPETTGLVLGGER